MTEKEKRIIKTFAEVLPNLNAFEQERLLAFGEGMAFKAKQERAKKEKEEHSLTA